MREHTRATLVAAGWRPDRAVSVDRAVRALHGAGHMVWPGLLDFLKRFVGLHVSFEVGDQADWFWFDPERAIALCWASWVDEYKARAGQVVVPIGYGARDHMLLLLGEDGTWFGGYDDVVGVLGYDVEGMLDALVEGREFLEVL